MSKLDPVKIDADAKVQGSPGRNPGISWPFAVDGRLEGLVDMANQGGLNTTRTELLAAIVCGFAPEDVDEIFRVLKHYRTATNQQVSMTEADGDNVIQIERYGPGRRKATS